MVFCSDGDDDDPTPRTVWGRGHVSGVGAGRSTVIQRAKDFWRSDARDSLDREVSRTGDSDPLLGRVLDGKFTLLSVLGRGGMGVVYRAHQASLERPVALKLMMGLEEGGDEEANAARAAEFQRRFFLEAATAAKLKHPNTITVFDYGSTNVDGEKVYYITMELLDGVTLSKLLGEGPMAPLRAVNIGLQICRSLREAHAAGIVHRDLKPGNVMLVRIDGRGADGDDDGDADFVKVLDFGLAKSRAEKKGPQLTKAGTFLGSPRYVAPEQIEGKPVDGRADIYSFGCVFYRMLSGRVPFDGQQAVEVMMKHLHDPVPPLSTPAVPVPKVLDDLVMHCLQKKAADRPASMDEVIAALKKARMELGGLVSTGNLVIPDDLKARLAKELGEVVSGPVSVPPQIVVKPEVRPAESTSPSQAAPGVAPPKKLQSSSQPSLNTPGPLSISGEWRIGPPPTGETRAPEHFKPPPPRSPTKAIAAGVIVGMFLCAVGIAARLGHLDPVLDSLLAMSEPDPVPVRPPSKVAAEAASARLRVTTSPAGADVFDVTSGVPKLLGITPLVVPWEIAAGDPSRELLLKLPGHVSARARVEPPPPSATGQPVNLDVSAALRPAPR